MAIKSRSRIPFFRRSSSMSLSTAKRCVGFSVSVCVDSSYVRTACGKGTSATLERKETAAPLTSNEGTGSSSLFWLASLGTFSGGEVNARSACGGEGGRPSTLRLGETSSLGTFSGGEVNGRSACGGEGGRPSTLRLGETCTADDGESSIFALSGASAGGDVRGCQTGEEPNGCPTLGETCTADDDAIDVLESPVDCAGGFSFSGHQSVCLTKLSFFGLPRDRFSKLFSWLLLSEDFFDGFGDLFGT